MKLRHAVLLVLGAMSCFKSGAIEAAPVPHAPDSIPVPDRTLRDFVVISPGLSGQGSVDRDGGGHPSPFRWLDLTAVTELTVGEAEALASYNGERIKLNGLREIEPAVAAALVEWGRGLPGSRALELNGLVHLDPEAAEAFSRWGRELQLNGLTEVAPSAVARLSSPVLYLEGLTELDDDVARALASRRGRVLHLNGLQHLEPSAAAELATWRARTVLHLNGLTSLDAETLEALGSFEGEVLHLEGLQHLDERGAAGLARWRGHWLYLNGLGTLDGPTAEALAAWPGRYLHLNGLQAVDVDTARGLARHSGQGLFLNGVKRLDAAAARALADHGGVLLELDGLESLDASTAAALSHWSPGDRPDLSRFHLNGLTRLDASAARGLSRLRVYVLELNGLTHIDVETATALAGWRGYRMLLRGLESVDRPTAAALGWKPRSGRAPYFYPPYDWYTPPPHSQIRPRIIDGPPPTPSGAAPGDDAISCNVVRLEPRAHLGRLSADHSACLEDRLSSAEGQAEKDAISRLLITNARVKRDLQTLEQLVLRHLKEIGEDAVLCYRVVYRLGLLGVERAQEALRLADCALEHPSQWSSGPHTRAVIELHRIQARAAAALWRQAAERYAEVPSDEARQAVDEKRQLTEAYARTWHEHATAAGQDAPEALELCLVAARAVEDCEEGQVP